MTETRVMDLFGGTLHRGDEDLDTPPPSKESATENELLDYMVLVLSRTVSCSLALDGRYALNQLLSGIIGMTYDVDVSLAGQRDYEELRRILGVLCDRFVKVGYIARYEMKNGICEEMLGGVDMYASDGRKILGVDVCLHNLPYSVHRDKIAFTGVNAFMVEKMLSDKLIAITSRKCFRRTKDFYDFYSITNFFDVDMKKLNELVKRRGGVKWENIPFCDDVLVQYQRVWNRLEIRGSFNEAVIKKPPLDLVIQRFYLLVLPLKYGNDVTRWEHKNGRCI